jgi:15-cis-phytoene synthase
MSRHELDAAGITDPALRHSYTCCRRINASHGHTFYLATLLLPPAKRPAVHALYGFARHADDIVDTLDSDATPARRAAELRRWSDRFFAGADDDPVLPAVHDTIDRYGIPRAFFEDFLASMAMDLTVSDYATWHDLERYMHGSAAVIGLQMVHVLGTLPGMREIAEPYARDLGTAFQLTNFIRDVGEDLDRGRLYLPKDELAMFAVSRQDLEARIVDAHVRQLLAFQIARARELLRSGRSGIRLLAPDSRDCIEVAAVLYGEILDAVEKDGYRVLDRRARVSRLRKLQVAGPGLARSWRARRA